ncbi:MAG: hypothetical protein ABSB71_13835 [Candidatus Bathyarchaeia archaeon]
MAKVDILEELRQEGKFSEFLLISWGIIELRADESILRTYCLSSQNPKADPLMELSIGKKLAILKDVGYLSQDDYNKVLEFKKKRNDLFHYGGIFIRGLIDKEKEEIMDLGIVAVDIMDKTAASIKQTVLVP